MFTGIIQARGTVRSTTEVASGRRLLIDAHGWEHKPLAGDSISVNGCCLTVIDDVGGDGILAFDVVQQTLRLTTLGTLMEGGHVNLEHAATPTTMLGGHIVQGHVDGAGEIIDVTSNDDEYRLRIRPPAEVHECIVAQGSIAVDGVSLTVATRRQAEFEVALIPTTLELTTLGALVQGSKVNLEADYIARTVVAWLQRREAVADSPEE